jgi:uncharacterized SAM-binding protein YcdF (DUF218 family)
MTEILFTLRKILPAMLMPFGLSLLLILFGIFRRRRTLAIAGLLLLLITSLPAFSDSLCFFLENQYPHLQAAQCPTADVVVALGGFAGENKRFLGEIQWYDAVDRFEGAVRLFQMKKAPILLFTDAQSPTDGRHNDTGEMLLQAAVQHGVPITAVHLTTPVSTTAGEAEAVQEFLLENGGRRVILVTSALHMGRAALLFRRAGVDVVPFPVDYQSEGWQWRAEEFVPAPAALDLTQRSLRELYGNLLYRLLPFAGPHVLAPR